MARRPVFIPATEQEAPPLVREELVDFEWHAGLALSQKRKSVQALHVNASRFGRLLEVSSKSDAVLGQALSAFKLMCQLKDGRKRSVEVVFQASKRFEHAGPFPDLLDREVREVREVVRQPQCGELRAFVHEGVEWPLRPRTAFYDFLYLSALSDGQGKFENLMEYDGFTDIEFNPKKSINCQARSCALYVALRRASRLGAVMKSAATFLESAGMLYGDKGNSGRQVGLGLD